MSFILLLATFAAGGFPLFIISTIGMFTGIYFLYKDGKK